MVARYPRLQRLAKWACVAMCLGLPALQFTGVIDNATLDGLALLITALYIITDIE